MSQTMSTHWPNLRPTTTILILGILFLLAAALAFFGESAGVQAGAPAVAAFLVMQVLNVQTTFFSVKCARKPLLDRVLLYFGFLLVDTVVIAINVALFLPIYPAAVLFTLPVYVTGVYFFYHRRALRWVEEAGDKK